MIRHQEARKADGSSLALPGTFTNEIIVVRGGRGVLSLSPASGASVTVRFAMSLEDTVGLSASEESYTTTVSINPAGWSYLRLQATGTVNVDVI